MLSFLIYLGEADPTTIKNLAANHLWAALLMCFGSGILTSLTPCVYPMIPITINIFGRAVQKGQQVSDRKRFNKAAFLLSLFYVGGMCLTYSVMGVVAGLTGSLFGKILQSTLVLAFLALLFLILALAQFGLFKIALPDAWQTKLAHLSGRDSTQTRLGVFVMGILSGLIISPCVGPVIAGILAFVFDTSNAWLGFLYFFSFSLGLGMLFLLIGGFSGLIANLPRSGPWMVRVNRILASCLLVASAYYGYVLIKQVGWLSVQTKTASLAHWLTDENQAMQLAQAEKKWLLIDFTAEWCAMCHEIDAQILQYPKVIAELSHFVLLKIDVTRDSEENSEKLRKYGVMSLPTLLFVDHSGVIKQAPRIHGLVPIDAFIATLREVRGSP